MDRQFQCFPFVALLALLVPLASEALVVSSSGRINFRNEGTIEGSSGTVNCAGDGIECEIVNGILNINVGGGAETSLEDPGGNGLINRTGAGVTEPYAGTTCTNQVLRVLSAAGAGTCVTLTSAYVDSSICTTAGVCTGYQAALGFTAENVANKDNGALSTSTTTYPTSGAAKSYVDTADALRELLANKSTDTALGASDTLYPTQLAVKTYVDTAVPAITGGPGIAVSGGTVSAALHEAASLTDGTEAALTCGADQGGKWQIGPANELQYCDYAETSALRSGQLTPPGLTWGDTSACASDENLGKLTVVGSVIGCFPDVADASTAAWNDGGTTSLTCGGGAQGQHQVMDSGRVEYCGGEPASALYAGFLLPAPYTWNLSACAGDGSTCKLTINSSNQLVLGTDLEGEGGEGIGDVTRVGDIPSGDAGTTGFPLTNLWYVESTAPSAPASTQGLLWLDATSQNFSIKTSDGVIKRMVQSVEAVANQVLASIAPDGAVGQVQLSSSNLSDGSTLGKLDASQIFTNKQVVPRVCTLSAASGTVTAPNADLCDVFERHDVAGTLTIPNPTATGSNPRPQQSITFSFYAASEQTVAWDTGYAEGYGVALPTTLPAGRYVGVRMQWNVLSAKWETWGNTDDTALDLADPDKVTGILPNANTTAASANTASAIVARDGSGNFTAGIITASLTGTASLATALAADLPYSGLTPATAASKLLGRGDGGAGDWQEVTLGTNLSMSGTTLNAAGGGGTGTIHLFVMSPKLPTSSAALVSSSGNFYKLIFDDSTGWCAWWQFNMPTDYTGSLKFETNYSPVGSTTGTLNLDVSVMAVTAGDAADFDTDSYDTANDCDDAAIPTTAGYLKRVSCTLTNADSVAAEDSVRVRVCRNTADTAATQIELIDPVLQYAK